MLTAIYKPMKPPKLGKAKMVAAKPKPLVPPDPRDAAYYSGVANQQFTANQQRAALLGQNAQAQQDYGTFMQRLIPKQARDIEGARTSANKAGLFYSGQLGRAEGDINTSYDQQRTDAQTQLSRLLAQNATSLNALGAQYGTGANGNYGLQGATLLADAITRQQQRDLLAPVPPAAPKPKALVPKRRGKAQTYRPNPQPRIGASLSPAYG